jgi:hypothetical protein
MARAITTAPSMATIVAPNIHALLWSAAAFVGYGRLCRAMF